MSSDLATFEHDHILLRSRTETDAALDVSPFGLGAHRQGFATGALIPIGREDPPRAMLITSGLVCVFGTLDSGRCSGCGFAGAGDWLGAWEAAGPQQLEAFCLTDVRVASMRVEDLVAAWARSPQLGLGIVRSLGAMTGQLQRHLLCACHHTLEARLATLVLRLTGELGDEIRLTHIQIADMLGVQRTTVTAAMKALQDHGAIGASRGRLRIRDAAALRRSACSCHRSQ